MKLALGLKISWQILWAYKFKSFLSVVGIMIACASVVVLVGFWQGAELKIKGRLNALGGNLLVINPSHIKTNFKSKGPKRHLFSKSLKPHDVKTIAKNCPSVALVMGMVKRPVVLNYKGEAVRTNLFGMNCAGFSLRDLELDKGRFFNEGDERAKRRVVIFGPSAYFNTFQSNRGVGRVVRLGKQPFRVIGLTCPLGPDLAGKDQDDAIYVPLNTALRRLLNIDYMDVIILRVTDGYTKEQAILEVTGQLRVNHGLKNGPNDFSIRSLEEVLRLKNETTRSLTMAMFFACVLAWIIGAVGILTIMLINVSLRKSEIGLRRALGAGKRDIRIQFLGEAILLSLAGGVLGVLLGVSTIIFISYMGFWSSSISLIAALSAIFVSLVLGLLCGIYPAEKAAKMEPVEAISSF